MGKMLMSRIVRSFWYLEPENSNGSSSELERAQGSAEPRKPQEDFLQPGTRADQERSNPDPHILWEQGRGLGQRA